MPVRPQLAHLRLAVGPPTDYADPLTLGDLLHQAIRFTIEHGADHNVVGTLMFPTFVSVASVGEPANYTMEMIFPLCPVCHPEEETTP